MVVTADNYKFKYKGTSHYSGKNAYVFPNRSQKEAIGPV